MKLAITICATNSYTYAMYAQCRRLQCMLQNINIEKGYIILVGDGGQTLKDVSNWYAENCPTWEIHNISLKIEDGKKNYKEEAQIIIATLRSYAFSKARSLGVDYCLSMDSDVLPQANSLKCMLHSLEFDDGYYSIATCPYPSQGGGGFLGGRGTVFRPIEEDFAIEERKLPDGMLEKFNKKEEELKKIIPKKEEDFKKIKDLQKELHDIFEESKKFPPKGNVYELNGKKWRKRGWLDQAYPALGRGCILPTDWCGFGMTLMNKKALSFAYFEGYEGKGTEDLFIVWHRWYQNGLKINVITHSPCDHVIRNPGHQKDKNAKYILQHAYHETEGECVGHLRQMSKPFYNFIENEKYDVMNNGVICPKEEKSTSEASK